MRATQPLRCSKEDATSWFGRTSYSETALFAQTESWTFASDVPQSRGAFNSQVAVRAAYRGGGSCQSHARSWSFLVAGWHSPADWQTAVAITAGIHRSRGEAIPSFFMRNWRVDRFMPSRVDAPRGPERTHFVSFSVARICARSASSRVWCLPPS